MHSGRDLRRLLGQFPRATLYRVKFVIIFIMSLKIETITKQKHSGKLKTMGSNLKMSSRPTSGASFKIGNLNRRPLAIRPIGMVRRRVVPIRLVVL